MEISSKPQSPDRDSIIPIKDINLFYNTPVFYGVIAIDSKGVATNTGGFSFKQYKGECGQGFYLSMATQPSRVFAHFYKAKEGGDFDFAGSVATRHKVTAAPNLSKPNNEELAMDMISCCIAQNLKSNAQISEPVLIATYFLRFLPFSAKDGAAVLVRDETLPFEYTANPCAYAFNLVTLKPNKKLNCKNNGS